MRSFVDWDLGRPGRWRWLAPVLWLAGACQTSSSTPSGTPDAPSQPGSAAAPDTLRLLEQATFGPTEELAAQVQAQGIEAYVDDQLATSATSLGTYPVVLQGAGQFCGAGAPPGCNRDNFTAFPVAVQFFKNALTAPDQLRQRVAFALGQILVVSGAEVRSTYGIAAYQELLLADAFGNFRALIEDVTRSPAMGRYLDMVNNDKPSPEKGTHPNENYARELMQLFTIGLVKLEADGSVVADENGEPVATYDQAVVSDMARVFTGWSYPTIPGLAGKAHNPPYYLGPMQPIAANHDTGAKTILDGVVLPAGQTSEKDLADALDAIFQHPNVGPFIGRQLIQHLVTSNPSPAYVARISAVFADDGHGVRGNLAAMVRAILLDPEARGDARTDPAYGKLREPALLVAGLARALGAASDGVYLRASSAALEEDVYQPPSVFSFYPPDSALPGSTLVSPPSQLFDSTTALARPNFVYTLLYTGAAADPTVIGSTGTSVSLAALAGDAGDPDRLVARLDALLTHGTLSADVKQAIAAAVTGLPVDPFPRVRMAAYLIGTSPQYQVER